MADNVIFPGTEMEVFEKYPDSRRLDHSNFGDVAKTTFAKGIISDFKVDDPTDIAGTIYSLVKVTGDWGESEFIPIFFNPKKAYWDGTGVLATDFDEETGAFKRAWMSFRGDDEVAVMLKEGVPVAIMGFADGVPRIGENYAVAKYNNDAVAIIMSLGGIDPSDFDWNKFLNTLTENGIDKDNKEWCGVLTNEIVLVKTYPVDKYWQGVPNDPEHPRDWGWAYKVHAKTYAELIISYFVVGPIIFVVQHYGSDGPTWNEWAIWRDGVPEDTYDHTDPEPAPVWQLSFFKVSAGLYSDELLTKVRAIGGSAMQAYGVIKAWNGSGSGGYTPPPVDLQWGVILPDEMQDQVKFDRVYSITNIPYQGNFLRWFVKPHNGKPAGAS